jgi:RNA polymerase sigma-70 factor (ECF subfamily)
MLLETLAGGTPALPSCLSKAHSHKKASKRPLGIIFIQIPRLWCLSNETVTGREQFAWCESLYGAKAAELILYGRALGLSHGEAEDVLQETFLALMQMVVTPPGRVPLEPEHYCIRSFRNRALNHRRSLWRRLTRELESLRWFEKSPGESEAERAAMDCLAALPVEQREAIVLKIWHRLTFEEIGGLLGISPNTAAGRYRYGLQKIKLQLEGAVYERERDEIAGEPVALMASAPAVGDA